MSGKYNFPSFIVKYFSHIVSDSFIFTEALSKKCLFSYLLFFFPQFPIFPSYFMQPLHNAALNSKLYYVHCSDDIELKSIII